MDEFLFLLVGVFIGFMGGMILFILLMLRDHEWDRAWQAGYKAGKGEEMHGIVYTDHEFRTGKRSQERR